jgi:hypothetical protein
MVGYLERYHQLSEKDVDGRLALAGWCARNGLVHQQADLLAEVLKLQPGHPAAYDQLLSSDATRNRPVDKEWAAKLQALLSPKFRLHHSLHFTMLTDADEQIARAQADAVEETYRTFYKEAPAIGLRPMPPAGRLVCLLFDKYDAYRDFLQRFEGISTPWAAGYYSWRTNRAAFYHDLDNPAFKDIRQQLAQANRRIADLANDMERLAPTDTALRIQMQQQLRALSDVRHDMTVRLSSVARLTTLAKARHEVTHQLLCNSGLQRRGQDYPFWLAEGLATNFEVCDDQGRAAPTLANNHRLQSYRAAQRARRLSALSDLILHRPSDDDDVSNVVARYAQVWGLVHFLWNKHPDKLRACIEALSSDPPPRNWQVLLTDLLGPDLDALEKELLSYMDSL